MHAQAGAYAPYRLQWGPVVQPIGRLPMQVYRQAITNVPLTGGQAQGTIPASGTLTLSVGPSGAGTIWYPASATVSTTSGVNDNSVCNIYLGPSGIPVTLVGTLNPGGYGTTSLAIPSLAPGQYLIAVWTGASNGDTASVNIVGLMSALSP
jgi:hypothetical protein